MKLRPASHSYQWSLCKYMLYKRSFIVRKLFNCDRDRDRDRDRETEIDRQRDRQTESMTKRLKAVP